MTTEEIENRLKRVAARIECDTATSAAGQQAFERFVVSMHLPAVLLLVSQAYEEGIQKAQEIRGTLHLRPLFDDSHQNGADMAAEEMQDHLRALKESLQPETVSSSS